MAREVRSGAGEEPTRGLLGQVGTVIADLPLFLTAPLYRRRHLRWGSTDDEVASTMPGDSRLPEAQFISTRSITIDAAPAKVWPWLVQVGCGRAGFYSNDLLDNLARPSATTIVSELQDLTVDHWVPMSPSSTPTDTTAFHVDSFEIDSWMLWAKPDSTWSWRLVETSGGGTRLVTRIHAVYDWSHPSTAALGAVLMEFGDFAMMRRMLRGIKARAESSACSADDSGRDKPTTVVKVRCTVDLLWIPLGAGQHVVRISGRIFEALSALVQRRPPCNLYHSALVVRVPDGEYVIEMTPVPGGHGARRGVVAGGAVGSAWLGKLRMFRYEIHRWHDGVIPDAARAAAIVSIPLEPACAQRLLEHVPAVPTPVWGRDELDAGEMWNSNSVTSWILHCAGIDTTRVGPPQGGRAPGWNAGLVVAARTAGAITAQDGPALHRVRGGPGRWSRVR